MPDASHILTAAVSTISRSVACLGLACWAHAWHTESAKGCQPPAFLRRATTFSSVRSASQCADPTCLMFRDRRRCEYTICTARAWDSACLAPDLVEARN
jgi:hypothetical protein